MKTSKNLLIINILIIILFAAKNSYSQSGWVQQISGTTNNLTNIKFVNDNTGFILINPFLKTNNGGLNWVPVPGLPPVTNICWADALTGYGCNDSLFKTIDGGNSWTNLNQNLFNQVSFANTMTGYATCTPDYISDFAITRLKKTIDGGSTWNSVLEFYVNANPNEWHNFFHIQTVNPQVTYFTINYDEIPGNHWSRVYRTSDGGLNWSISRNSDDSLRFTIFHFPSADTGYVASIPVMGSQTHYLFKYVNNIWTTVFRSSSEIRGIHFPTNTTGYILTGSYNIFKTIDGGANWHSVNPQTSVFLNSFYFTSPTTGYAVGNNGIILKTTTGGELPRSVSGTVKFTDNNQPVASGYVKALTYDSVSHEIITVDSAQIQPNGLYSLPHCPPVYIDIMAYENDEEELSFVPTYHLSSVSWQGSVKVKPDSNLTNIDIGVKRILNNGGMMKIAGYIYSNYLSDYTGLKDAVIYAKSGDNYKGYSISLSSGYYCIDSLPAGSYSLYVDRMGCVSAENTLQLVNSSLENVNFFLEDYFVPVFTQTNGIPEKYELFQNYPNPFNPVTNIVFSIPKTSHVQLVIYDLQGRLVRTILNGELGAGTYKTDWNAASYSSGVYFYKLTADGFSDAKRMILIK